MTASWPRHYRFDSYQEFAAFDQALTQQLATGQAQAVAPPAGPVPRQASAYYHPLGFPQPWVLSEPDNAWRGYFLPLDEALTHEAKLRGSDQRARLGCLLVLGLLGALAAWGLLG